MILHILDPALEMIGVIDDYYSLTWAERYSQAGDFEMELPISYDGNPMLALGNFVAINDSDTLMIIQDMQPSSSGESSTLLIAGESAESILKQRSITQIHYFNAALDYNVMWLVSYYFIDNTAAAPPFNIAARIVDLLEYYDFTTFQALPAYKNMIDSGTVYEHVKEMCESAGFGFKMTITPEKLLRFRMYEGADRSYEQNPVVNDFVIFSPTFDNVLSSSYLLSSKSTANVVHVYVKDDPTHEHTWVYHGVEPDDIDRFEATMTTTIERTDVSPNLTDAQVLEIITTRGKEFLRGNQVIGVFEADVILDKQFVYGVDFFIGDFVQCYIQGRGAKARVIECVRSWSVEGVTKYISLDFSVDPDFPLVFIPV
jgi:hypothetical protein